MWMITIAVPVFDVETNTFVGVAGSDMLLTTISKNIQNIVFLDSGKVTLFETGGLIVADREWNASVDDTIPWTYSDLQDPPVSDNLWNTIENIAPGVTDSITQNINGDDYSITISHILGFDDKYYLVVFILTSEITKPIDSIITEIQTVNIGITVGLILGLVFASVLVILIVICTTNSIIKPIDQMNKNINQMIQNIGTENITEGVTGITGGIGEEQQALKKNFNLMIEHVKEFRSAATEQVENPYFLGQHEYVYQYEGGLLYPVDSFFLDQKEYIDEAEEKSRLKSDSETGESN